MLSANIKHKEKDILIKKSKAVLVIISLSHDDINQDNKYNLQLRSKSTWNFVHQDTGFLSSLKI